MEELNKRIIKVTEEVGLMIITKKRFLGIFKITKEEKAEYLKYTNELSNEDKIIVDDYIWKKVKRYRRVMIARRNNNLKGGDRHE